MGCLVDPAAFCNFMYRQIRIFQKLLGIGETQLNLVFMRRTAHIPGKLPDKVVFAHMKLPGQIIQKQRLLKMPVDIAFRLPDAGRDQDIVGGMGICGGSASCAGAAAQEELRQNRSDQLGRKYLGSDIFFE